MPDIEIIPNWHPILVHFSIGLLGIAAVLMSLSTVICAVNAKFLKLF